MTAACAPAPSENVDEPETSQEDEPTGDTHTTDDTDTPQDGLPEPCSWEYDADGDGVVEYRNSYRYDADGNMTYHSSVVARSASMAAWEDEGFLETLRREGDPAADALVTRIVREEGLGQINIWLRHIVDNDEGLPTALPDDLGAWLDGTS